MRSGLNHARMYVYVSCRLLEFEEPARLHPPDFSLEHLSAPSRSSHFGF